MTEREHVPESWQYGTRTPDGYVHQHFKYLETWVHVKSKYMLTPEQMAERLALRVWWGVRYQMQGTLVPLDMPMDQFQFLIAMLNRPYPLCRCCTKTWADVPSMEAHQARIRIMRGSC
jgi:hypothetical protein